MEINILICEQSKGQKRWRVGHSDFENMKMTQENMHVTNRSLEDSIQLKRENTDNEIYN